MTFQDNMSRRTFLGLAGTIAAGAGLSLVGCGSGSPSSNPGASAASTAATSASPAAAAGSKSVIVLWSYTGNTLQMAERVSELSGAEIYRIEAADPYPEDFQACADRAKREQDDGVYPDIANPIANWGDYGTVFLGYPIWWYEMPMIVQGFVRDHDWEGKTVVPFNSHEGSGDGGTYDDLREMTGTTVVDGLAIRGESVAESLDQVDAWYSRLGL